MSDDNGKQNFWVEMLSDEKEKQISSTRFITVGGTIVGWIIVLLLAVALLFGRLEGVDLTYFTLTTGILLGGAYGTKAHQNQRKKYASQSSSTA